MAYPVSPAFLQALRHSHTALVRVEVWNAGVQVIPDLAISDGAVTVDGSNQGVRRSLNLTTARDQAGALWELLAPIGTEIVPHRGLRFPDGTTEMVPCGVFGIDEQAMSYGVDGTIQLTAPDRWARVQRARFLQPVTTNGVAVSEALRLTKAAVNVGSTSTATSTAMTKQQVWDRDRDQAVNELVTAAGAELFFNATGGIVVRDIPALTNRTVWTVDAGAAGVLLDANRTRDRSRTYNVVVVAPAATDGTATYAPQIAYDNDPTSPTYVGGPFGQVPMFYSSPLLVTAAQAMAAAQALLRRATGLAAQLTAQASVNPALEAGDCLNVLLPDGNSELHMVDGFTIPLTVDAAQQITTRSTRPDGDIPDGS